MSRERYQDREVKWLREIHRRKDKTNRTKRKIIGEEMD